MLKKRVVATVIMKEGMVVQSIGFQKYLPVGDVGICIEFLNNWGIDEIILLNIDETRKSKGPDFDKLIGISQKCFVPLTVGGGIRNVEDMRKLVHYGADKISINTLALEDLNSIKEASEIFGSQCVVVSIDVKKVKGKYEIFSSSKSRGTGLDPVVFAKKAEQLGAGELLVHAIDRDGAKSGYEVELVKKIADAVSIPTIASGGAGHPKHFLEVFEKTNAMAVAAGNFFHFTEHSPMLVKSFLGKNGIDVRVDTQANYQQADFFKEDGRIKKRKDAYLNQLRFEYISEEKI